MNSRFTESLRPNRNLNLTTNTMMLLTHLAFILLYLKMKTPILFAYNLVSVAVFLVNYYFAWTRRDAIFYGVIYGEVLVFTTLNILLLGWGYGFELYSFSYAISIQLIAFFLFEEERVKNLYLIVGAVVTVYFLGMRLLTYNIQPLYPVADVVLQRRLFLCNALFTLLLCVFYVGMFTKVLLTLTKGLQYTSTHDPLTDLYNRRRMMEIMGEKQSRAAVAILDIDDFKQINDTYGHAAGDAVIKALAERLKALGDRGIVSGRWGGEEFVTFVNGVDGNPDRMEDDLRALVHEVAGSPVEFDGHRIGYTVTIGMKQSDDGEDIQKAINAADALLYEGKQSGKNRLITGNAVT